LLIEGYLSKVSLRVSAMDVAVAAVAVAAAAAGAIINAAGRSGNRDSLGEKSLAYVGFFVFRSACGLGFYYCLCRLAPGKLNEQLYQSTLLYLILLER